MHVKLEANELFNPETSGFTSRTVYAKLDLYVVDVGALEILETTFANIIERAKESVLKEAENAKA